MRWKRSAEPLTDHVIPPKPPETLIELKMFEDRAEGKDPLTVMHRNDVKALCKALLAAWKTIAALRKEINSLRKPQKESKTG